MWLPFEFKLPVHVKYSFII
jgi:hypothetical protein